MAASKQLTQAQASPDPDETTLSGLILESLDAIAGPLAILAAGLTWYLAFELTVPPPQPAPARLVPASESVPATTDVLALEPEKAMPDSTAESAPLIGAGLSVADARRHTAAPTDPSLARTPQLP